MLIGLIILLACAAAMAVAMFVRLFEKIRKLMALIDKIRKENCQ